MAGLWINSPATREGKYPVVFRRDGTQVEFPHFLINVHDPGFVPAMRAYALEHERLGTDPAYVRDCFDFADRAEMGGFPVPPKHKADPDAPPHRKDHPLLLLMNHRGWSLDDLVEWVIANRLADTKQARGMAVYETTFGPPRE